MLVLLTYLLTSHSVDEFGADDVWGTRGDGLVGVRSLEGQVERAAGLLLVDLGHSRSLGRWGERIFQPPTSTRDQMLQPRLAEIQKENNCYG